MNDVTLINDALEDIRNALNPGATCAWEALEIIVSVLRANVDDEIN